MYIARSVCLGTVATDRLSRTSPPMPELSAEARTLYVRAYGAERYERYNDKEGTRHGARPPDVYQGFGTAPPFRHRPEHDVESIYWSMVSALLRAHPKGVDRESKASKAMTQTWDFLLSHDIPEQGSGASDDRQMIVTKTAGQWQALFLGDMKDIGTLLFQISDHMLAEYALWGDGLRPDHLHEAVQRIILQYLVDHKQPIELDIEYSRPITAAKKATGTGRSTRGTVSGTVSVERRETRGSARSSKTRVDVETGRSSKRKSVDMDTAQSASSSGTRVSDASRPVVIDPKRKGSGQTGRSSKRLRDNSGLPQSVEERAEDDS